MPTHPEPHADHESLRLERLKPESSGLADVVEKVGVKYTMFLPDGTPCRATVTMSFKEASALSFKKGGS